MSRSSQDDGDLDALIEQITVNACGDFDGLLPWGHLDNRPFLRCMHGFGLCLWRLGRFAEAGRVFDRMLWLNPSDNQGARFLIDDIRARRVWEDRREEG